MDGGDLECIWNLGLKSDGKRLLGRLRHRLEDIRMDFREVRLEGVD
jgi:hypothetical protein